MNFRPAAFLLLLVSCTSLPDSGPPDWTPEAFQGAMEQAGVHLVDLRTPGEAAAGRLPGAVLVDYWSADFPRFLAQADKNAVYLVYCSHGIRGREAAIRMRQAGFIEVHNLAGGLAGWKEHP